MAEYDNNMRGVLFKNLKKEAETHADYQGNITIDGVDYWLNAWLKTSQKTGDKFMSLTVKPKEAPKTATAPRHGPRFDGAVARQLDKKPDPRKGSGFEDFEDTPF
jgi:hypothetical protein